MASRILVTGGLGFIGSSFVHYWKNKYPDDEVIVVDNLCVPEGRKNWPGLPAEVILQDIRKSGDMEVIFKKYKFNLVVHFAAESHVDRSIESGLLTVDNNVLGTTVLLENSRRFRDPDNFLFMHISTDEVYGSLGYNQPSFTELSPLDPRSAYSASKAGSDMMVMSYFHTYGLPVKITRCSNNFGCRQDSSKLIPKALSCILNGQSIPIYGDGKNIRDWIDVEDHAEGIERVIYRGRVGEVYNLGGGMELSNLIVVRKLDEVVRILRYVRPECKSKYPNYQGLKIQFVEDRKGHDLRYSVDYSKAAKELGFSPWRGQSEGFTRLIKPYTQELDRWKLENLTTS